MTFQVLRSLLARCTVYFTWDAVDFMAKQWQSSSAAIRNAKHATAGPSASFRRSAAGPGGAAQIPFLRVFPCSSSLRCSRQSKFQWGATSKLVGGHESHQKKFITGSLKQIASLAAACACCSSWLRPLWPSSSLCRALPYICFFFFFSPGNFAGILGPCGFPGCPLVKSTGPGPRLSRAPAVFGNQCQVLSWPFKGAVEVYMFDSCSEEGLMSLQEYAQNASQEL